MADRAARVIGFGSMHRQDLERMTREQLISHAERLEITRPRVLTQPELIDEIIGRTAKDEPERARARGWLGRARDLLASVVERGLHLPEAARALRKGEDRGWKPPPPPLPTMTLAEIYAAQGHLERAIAVLDEVLAREPDHREARAMRQRFAEQAQRSRSRIGRDKEAPSTAPSASTEAPKEEAAPVEDAETASAAPPADEEAASPEEVIPATMPAMVKAPSAPPPPSSSPPQPAVIVSEPAPAHPVEVLAAPPQTVAAHVEEAPPPSAPAPSQSDLEAASTEPGPLPRAPSPPAAVPAPAPVLAPLLEEPPLPERYGVDEIVAIAVDPRTIYLYWEVRPTTLAHARAVRPEGQLSVRVASVIASWEGPVVDTRDLHVDALYGDRFLRDVQPGSNVRVSVGWLSAGSFEPFAVGSEVTAPRAVPVESVAQEVARWEAEPVVAPFQSRRVDVSPIASPPYGASFARTGAAPRRAADVAFAERARASSAHAGPVDSGVTTWGVPPVEATSAYEEAYEETYLEQYEEVGDDAQAWWSEPGGSSELGRGGPGRRLRPVRRSRLVPGAPGAPGVPGALPAPGGAFVFGGASDLLSS
jgi:Domain of unknown function (DUF4912)